jgi:tRNA threonylcarbamoyl adenosine modification protein YeaZ
LPPELAPRGPLVLGFDTAAAHCAAALVCGDRLLAAAAEPMATGQAERLLPLLEALLAQGGVGWGDLAALGVGTGPGNFTGLRIAVAAARGLALGLGRPAIGVTGFEALAAGAAGPVTAVIAAQRGEVYACRMPGGVPWRGPVAEFRADPAAPPVGAGFAPPRWPVAEAVARLALVRLGAPQPRPAPVYLRPPDAALPAEPAPVILP